MGSTREPILADLPKDFLEYVEEYMKRNYSQDYIKKLSSDKYEFYCKSCMTTETIDSKLAKTIRNTHLCPYCFQKTKTFHRQKYPTVMWNYWLHYMKFDGKHVGYAFFLTKRKEDKEPKFYHEQVAYWDETNRGKKRFFARYVNAYSGATSFDWYDSKWRQRSSSGSYWCLENRFRFWDIYSEKVFDGLNKKRSYKQYVQSTMTGTAFKSNQMELIKNNVFNEGMLCAIKIFDLKSAEEVYKYKSYIMQNENYLHIRVNDAPFNLNIHYLDYLSRNKIRFVDYYDYLCDLKILGLKPDKPKDFRFRSEAIGDLVQQKKDEKFNKNIKKRFKTLKENIYEKKNIRIKPIESLDEIYYVAKSLHNCMARMYLEDYAKGHTDLYCMWLDDKPLIAIEILNGGLAQVRADHNEVPESKYKRIVNNWYKELNYGTGS